MIEIHQFCQKACVRPNGSYWPLGLDADRTAATLRALADELEKCKDADANVGLAVGLHEVRIESKAAPDSFATTTLILVFHHHVGGIVAVKPDVGQLVADDDGMRSAPGAGE